MARCRSFPCSNLRACEHGPRGCGGVDSTVHRQRGDVRSGIAIIAPLTDACPVRVPHLQRTSANPQCHSPAKCGLQLVSGSCAWFSCVTAEDRAV
jgi:hypothetical protein